MTMVGYIRIDGAIYRFLGVDTIGDVAMITNGTIPPLQQINLRVQPTQTQFTFQGYGIELTLTYTQPAFPDQLNYFTRPYVYITTEVRSLDSTPHSVQLYMDFVSDIVVNNLNDWIMWEDVSFDSQSKIYRHQSYNQYAFVDHGDRTKPNWGHLYLATQSLYLSSSTQTNVFLARQAFMNGGRQLPQRDNEQQPKPAKDNWPVNAFLYDYGQVEINVNLSSYIILAYDDVYSMNYFSHYQIPYWKHIYGSWRRMLSAAFQEYEQIKQMANEYDEKLIQEYSNTAGI
ncbi:unnamed protein product [Didymodactylos carnosus]|uniref:Glutaminase A N-terminal domain-containing protein n=1 Tax=Didymodactylos carnosus TaxID=1234261 RepID=A0A815ULE4_9BILA|nr:unnamed protein product [Didymodactylos carnosus]CAF4381573.1 unnamed protein product [Didymodactylos carnosus]